MEGFPFRKCFFMSIGRFEKIQVNPSEIGVNNIEQAQFRTTLYFTNISH